MARVRIDIDGKTAMDEVLDRWTADPPEIVREQLAANATPKLYMRCMLLILADAAMSDTDTAIDITTDDDSWQMTVTR